MILTIFCLLINVNGFFASAAGKKEPPTFLSVSELEKFWAPTEFKTTEFKAEDFKSGNSQLRARMVPDLVKRKLYIGQPLESVEQELGPADGNFNKGGEAAYLLGTDNSDHSDHSVRSALMPHKDVLQLVFIADKEGKKVDDVKIHRKYCADSAPPPPDPPPIRITSKDKKLGFEITGEVAKAMWNHMVELSGDKGIKKGDSMKCSKGKWDNIKCSFTFDPDGVVEAK